MRRLTQKEREALRHAASFVATVESFPSGINKKTLEKLAEWGLLEYKTCPTYGDTGYLTTDAGYMALDNR